MTPTLATLLVSLGLSLPPQPAPLLPAPAPTSASPSTSARSASPLTNLRSGADPSGAGGVWPLEPEPTVIAGFAPGEQDWLAGHRGVDLLARAGQPVRSAVAGVVSFAGTIAGRGVVVIVHGDLRTTYEPVQASVTRGDRVVEGAEIGNVQGARGHCPPRSCLHWGLLAGEEYRDPLSLLGRGPVRLLAP